MIRLVFLFILLAGIHFNGKCDTITNWQVYHNQLLIAKLDLHTQGTEIVINKKDWKAGDTITVNFFQDTPCFSCESTLSVEDREHKLIAGWNGTGTFTPKKFSLDELMKSEEEYFEVWYYERDVQPDNEGLLLFKIKLE